MTLISTQIGFATNSSTYIVATYLDNVELAKFLDKKHRKRIASKIYNEVLDILSLLKRKNAIAEGNCYSLTQIDIENALKELANRYVFNKHEVDRPIRFSSYYYRSIGVDESADFGECRDYILPAVIIALSSLKHESVITPNIELSY